MPVPTKQVGANIATDPQTANVAIPTANVEQSYALIDGLKQVIIKLRGTGTMRYGWVANVTDDANPYITMHPGTALCLDNLKFVGKTIYFRTDIAPNVLEIQELY